ncbi:nucleotide exchange factor GrpE [Rickettsia endosymbiont of Cardiosporidium cionae]|uniref:nucleotide exchange factor GrpE n=1 Tax=Rickettsia endosymbiont of Cardiosporidium cionae TaxID=2777155 RepID=UPI001893FCC3|nr:nucleotide exchange factor GrpE [Rickettsia endosymbiont of Cardiosporidium cionae]KAF8818849.1 Protein GrpE [Rickettsia endosymbiont of Cardiosporidium cionae]
MTNQVENISKKHNKNINMVDSNMRDISSEEANKSGGDLKDKNVKIFPESEGNKDQYDTVAEDEIILDDNNYAELLEKEILNSKKLSQTIQELNDKIKELEDKFLRSVAESENIRSRFSKSLEEEKRYSIRNFSKDLIPVIDSLNMAISHGGEASTENIKDILAGITMTKQELESAFKKHKVEAIVPSVGDKFDYHNHNAISQKENNDYEEGTILNVMQVGYKIQDRLIRPASVVVSKRYAD